MASQNLTHSVEESQAHKTAWHILFDIKLISRETVIAVAIIAAYWLSL